MDKVIILLSKRKNILTLTGAGLFVGIGCWMTIKPENFVSAIFRNTAIIRIVGVAGFAFFGLCLIFIARKLFDKKPGLIIDQYGITNNTNVISMGLIEWGDIIDVRSVQVMSTRFLVVYTNNPEKYLARVKNKILKCFMKMNYKTYGSPISITSNSLKVKYNDLEHLIRSELKKRQ